MIDMADQLPTAPAPIAALREAGVSVWLDDLSRERIATGNLGEVKAEKSIVGVTTNPAIFAAAMGTGTHYDDQLEELKLAGTTADAAVYAMSVKDVQDACDLFRDTYDTTGGKDGRVSIEVDPRYAADEAKTIAQARELWDQVDRPNAMIKVPATKGSLPAIEDALAEGISVNVTLIFSVARYREVMGATNPANADAGTIRKEFAVSVGENSVHGSDAPETAKEEIAFFFSGLELVG